jgi:hypothetical protein
VGGGSSGLGLDWALRRRRAAVVAKMATMAHMMATIAPPELPPRPGLVVCARIVAMNIPVM